jgi:hypothetical protein
VKGYPHVYTDVQIQWLRDNRPTTGRKELTQKYNALFGTEILQDALLAKCQRMGIKSLSNGNFKPGMDPWNKGVKGLRFSKASEFKKGNLPQNYLPVGTERISKDGIIEVKFKDPNRWRSKHSVIYEQHHGAIPKCHVVIFVDGDRANLSIDNLVLVSRAELAVLNKRGFKNEPKALKKSVIGLAKVDCALSKIQRTMGFQ